MSLDLADLRRANVARDAEVGAGLGYWGVSQRALIVSGEVGKLMQTLSAIQDGVRGGDEVRRDIEDGLANSLLALDLLAAILGIDLAEATTRAFDRDSERLGSSVRLGGDKEEKT